MRRDLKDVIIDTGRGPGDNERHVQVHGRAHDELDLLPERQGLKKRWTGWGKHKGDRLGPMKKFLRSRVGQQWNKVWSEVCEHADSREIRGFHLRDHIKNEVRGAGGQEYPHGRYPWHRNEFYVDAGGFLREQKADYRKYKRPHDPDECYVGDNRFVRINNCWFDATYAVRQVKKQHWDWFKEEWTYYYKEEEYIANQRQLSKKDLKKFGLSNEPGWDWRNAA